MTEPISITYAELPSYLGVEPTLPIYHQRQRLKSDPRDSQRQVFEAYMPADVSLEDIAIIRQRAHDHMHKARLVVYLVTEIPASVRVMGREGEAC